MEKLAPYIPMLTTLLLEVVLPLVAIAVAWALRKWVLVKLSDAQRERLVKMAETAYWVAAQWARKTPGKSDDIALVAVKSVIDQLGRPLAEDEKATVNNVLKAFHEQVRPEANGVGAAAVKSTQ